MIIRLFAAFADFTGSRTLEIPYVKGMTCKDVWQVLQAQYPRLQRIPVLFAVRDEYVPAETELQENDELLLFPPVSGGSVQFLHQTPLSVERAMKAIQDPEAGGEALFIGRIRRMSEGRVIKYLYYECHAPMAEKQIAGIMEEMFQRWPVKKVHIEHRLGKLEVGDIAVIVAVSSMHRKEAMEACRYGIDELKHRVPIWKKEVSETGEEWVGACGESER